MMQYVCWLSSLCKYDLRKGDLYLFRVGPGCNKRERIKDVWGP